MSITLKAQHLAAAWECVAKADIRTFLEGVHFCCNAREDGTAIQATNGHIMLRLRTTAHWDGDGNFSLQFDAALLRELRKKTNYNRDCKITRLPGNHAATLDLNGVVHRPTIIEGQYPDIDRLWRARQGKKAMAAAPNMNPDYIIKMGKVCQLLAPPKESPYIRFAYAGSRMEPVVVEFPTIGDVKVDALVMPIRPGTVFES